MIFSKNSYFTEDMDFQNLPKVELHLHLDCSLSYEVVQTFWPGISEQSYQENFVGTSCGDLNAYLEKAARGIELMQTKEQLQLVTLDLFKQLEADRVLYAEIRFAPLEHCRKGLTPEEVVEIVARAMQRGTTQTGVRAGLILCTLRHYSETQSMYTAQLAGRFSKKGVVGFDIAADEAGYPLDAHIRAFKFAHSHGIPCTAHAGEACGASSVEETLEKLRPQRIGHGVRSVEKPDLVDRLIREDIHLEICLSSNLKTQTVATLEEHPADLLYQKGVSLSLNTDGRTISATDLTKEYQLYASVFNWNNKNLLNCNLEAIRQAFTTPSVKAGIRNRLLEEYS